MHKIEDITIDSITKVEGNARLEVKVAAGSVTDLKFIIGDYRRFYTDAVVGKPFLGVPAYLSRICGTCSMAHQFASIEAVEKALGIFDRITEQTRKLRTLAYNGTMIRDHALHLYIFCLPDVLGIDSVLEIDDSDEFQHQLLHDAFDLKAIGNQLSTVVSGAFVHSPLPIVGGFTKLPKLDDVKKLTDGLEGAREKIIRGIELFAGWDAKLERNTDYIALVNDDFDFLEGDIRTSGGKVFAEKDMPDLLRDVVIPYSQSEGYILESDEEDYLVGSLARINLNGKHIHEKTKADVQHYLDVFPSNNIFHNCLAQAIETLHCIDYSLEIIETLKITDEEPIKGSPQKGNGVGVIEAPRGTLYHMVELDKNGIVVNADVTVPTSQNQINIENDLKKFFDENIGKKSKDELKLEAEKIIRAYDPCMSCATNFLEIDWTEE